MRHRATRLRGGLLPIALLAALVAPPSLAQEPDRTALNGVIDLVRLVDLCAERLDLNIEYDASVLQGTVTLRLGEPVSDEELWSLTNHVLASRGLTTVRTRDGGVLSVVRAQNATGLSRPEDQDLPGPKPGHWSLVTEVEHIPAKDAVDALKVVVSGPAAQVTAIPSSNLLLIADLRPRVEQALELLEMVDVPGAGVSVDVVPTETVSAAAVVSAANEVVQAQSGLTNRPLRGRIVALPDGSGVLVIAPVGDKEQWRELVARLDRADQISTRTYGARYFPVREVATLVNEVLFDPRDATTKSAGFRVVTDHLTGTLVVTGTPAQHEQVAALIARLDETPPEARRQVQSFAIRNRAVTEVVSLLQELVTAQVFEGDDLGALAASAGATQQTRREFGPTTAPTSAPLARLSSSEEGEEEIPSLTLAADAGTNTLLAVGEPRLLGQVAGLIQQLDVRQPQVMLEVTVVSLNDAQSLDLGVELQAREESGSVQGAVSSLFGLGSPDVNAGTIGAGGTGFTGVVLSPGDYSVLLQALETVNVGRSASRPKVLVNNNEQATFDSVLQQPFLSTNASDTVATTSFGGTQDAGTSISVRPQIAEGDHLVLEYQVALSEFVGESLSPSLPPPRQQNTLQSVVTIPDGFTVVLGGLEVTTDADASSRVPFLGDLPLFGWLFESRATSKSRTRFFIFLRASVLRHQTFEDLRYLTIPDQEAADVEAGLPSVLPRVIR